MFTLKVQRLQPSAPSASSSQAASSAAAFEITEEVQTATDLLAAHDDATSAGASRSGQSGIDSEALPSSSLQTIGFSSGNPRVENVKGAVHLFRDTTKFPGTPHELPEGRKAKLCVLAVPSFMTGADFCRFTGTFLSNIQTIKIVRNNNESDHYMVLLSMDTIFSADAFFRHFNGRPFSSLESEICRVLFVADVSSFDSAKEASTPPAGQTELPSCPVCLERLDQHISGILTTVCNHSFHSACISKWADSSCPVCRYCQEPPDSSSCSECGTVENLWICLICGFVGCGRYKEGHAVRHFQATQHGYSLEVETQRVWDYVGDNFVHRLIQSKTDGKLVELPAPSDIRGGGEERGEKKWEGEGEAGGESIGGVSSFSHEMESALLNSKLEAIAFEYNHLLTSQLESQRQYFEGLLHDAQMKHEATIGKEVERAIGAKLSKVKSQLDRAMKEKDFLKEVNDSLIKNQKQWQLKFSDMEERQKEEIHKRDERIRELEEQVRDLMVYIETRKAIEQSAEGAEIKGAAVMAIGDPPKPTKKGFKGRKK